MKSKSSINPLGESSNFILYATPNGAVQAEAFVKDESIRLTQKAMAELFECSSDNISFHLKNIYRDGELEESATTEDSSVVRQEGSRNQGCERV